MHSIVARGCSRYATGHAHRADKYLSAHNLRPPRMLSQKKPSHTELLAPFFYKHQRMKEDAMVIDPVAIAKAPKVRESTFADPWKVVRVSEKEILAFEGMEDDNLHSCVAYGIGVEKEVTNTNPYDLPSAATSAKISSKKPGEGTFNDVATGPYGQREFKYLYVIDHSGMHIVREMTACPESSRGIFMHSLIKDRGVLGGEIFFDDDNPKVVYINFGSSRLTFRNTAEADMTARFILSLGYEKVVAVYADRDFDMAPYGMKDRYGQALANAVYVRESL
jgi:hypothetical protein